MAKKIESKRAIKVPNVLVTLGKCLEIKGTHVHYFFPSKENISLCSDIGNKLYAIKTNQKLTPKKYFLQLWENEITKIEKAIELYEKFHDFETKSGTIIKPPRGFWWNVDRCEMIVYSSDKWSGKRQKYIHEFKNPPLIWVNHKTNPALVMLSGGRIKITPAGIRG